MIIGRILNGFKWGGRVLVIICAGLVLTACAHDDTIPYPRATHADPGEDNTLTPAQQNKAIKDLDEYAAKRQKEVKEAIKKSGKKKK